MTLTDTGPLVALVDEDDAHHAACALVLPALSPPMVTPWPCFTEAVLHGGHAPAEPRRGLQGAGGTLGLCDAGRT